MSGYSVTLRGHITPEDKARSDYAYVPFDLPFAARRLRVRYAYSAPMSSDKVEGGNVIDIGLFDPKGSEFPGGAGFRGWSGSARQSFEIGLETATPGYLPGPLPAGRYQVILGLYRIWPHGADYELDVEAEPLDPVLLGEDGEKWITPGLEEKPLSPLTCDFNGTTSDALGEAQGPITSADDTLIWLRGDLQSHTYHSDAKGSPQQLIAKARALGLDFLAVTDHNTVSHHQALDSLDIDDLLLIPGQEATTYYGHMNIWGTGRWCDFRCRTAHDLRSVIDLAHASGGVCSINHPKQGGPAWEYGPELPVDTMEVWQGPWPYRNEESLALWDDLLSRGRRLPAVGGSDYHCPAAEETSLLRLGQPTTWVQTEGRSVSHILAGIRAGRACISAQPGGPRLELRAEAGSNLASMGDTLHVDGSTPIRLMVTILGGHGLRLRTVADGRVVDEQPVTARDAQIERTLIGQRYLRCELIGDATPEQLPPNIPPNLDLRDWRWALSNPVYLAEIDTKSGRR